MLEFVCSASDICSNCLLVIFLWDRWREVREGSFVETWCSRGLSSVREKSMMTLEMYYCFSMRVEENSCELNLG